MFGSHWTFFHTLIKLLRRSLLSLSALSVSALVVLPLTPAQAQPQTFPAKPVRILVGFTPGGGPDIIARVVGQKLSEAWKQPVTVENRLGAGGNIAAQALTQAPADGYTLLSVTPAHAVSAAIQTKLPYDAVKDFAGVTITATGPALLIVAPDIGVKTVADLIALAKAKPGQLNYSSAGIGSGSHFAGELFRIQSGINVTHVPYKGIPEALADTMAGRVHFFVSPYASAINLVKEGRARAIAVTGDKRMPDQPDLPTVNESGLPGYKWIFWYGLLAPAKTPKAVLDQLNADVARALREPDVRQRFLQLGIEPAPSSGEEFERLIAEEIANFGRIARAANIKVE